MKCPNEEQLMLYVDRELTTKEIGAISSHIAACKHCQQTVKVFKADLEVESMLRQKVSAGFERYKSADKIMKAVLAEPRHKSEKSIIDSILEKFWVRLLVPAFALVMALFFIFGGASQNKTEEIFVGKSYKISVFTNSAESFADSVAQAPNTSFLLDANKMTKLDGNFLLNVVAKGENYSLLIDGKTSFKFNEQSMILEFADCEADISLLNGASISLVIDGKKQSITKRKPYTNKQKPLAIKEENLKGEPKKAEKTVASHQATKAEEKPVTAIAADSETVNASECESFEEETLTSNVTDGIVILNVGTDSEEETSPSPFGDQKLGGF